MDGEDKETNNFRSGKQEVNRRIYIRVENIFAKRFSLLKILSIKRFHCIKKKN